MDVNKTGALPRRLSRRPVPNSSPTAGANTIGAISPAYQPLSTFDRETGKQDNPVTILEDHELHSLNSVSHTEGESHDPTKFQRVRDTVRRFWLWETGGCILALACLGAIVAVLAAEDGKELDGWSWSIPPGATVSFIGTLGKGAMGLALAQVISQLKWLHFLDSKSLSHLRHFDGSSRGPIGSIVLIWTSKRLLASIAALLMILTVLFDPFVQLVFSFPIRLAEDPTQTAILATTKFYGGFAALKLNATRPETSFWTSVNDALGDAELRMTTICSTANCTWSRPEPITTLGVCGSCADVTTTTRRSCNQWTVDNPSNFNRTNTTCTYTFASGRRLQAHGWHDNARKPGGGQGFDPTTNLTYSTLWNSTGVNGGLTIPNITLLLNSSTVLNGTISGYDPTAAYVVGPAVNVSVYDGTILAFDVLQVQLLQNQTEKILPPARCSSCSLYWCERIYDGVTVQNGIPSVASAKTERLWFVNHTTQLTYTDKRLSLFRPDELDKMRSSGTSTSRFRYSAYETMSYSLLNLFFNSYYTNYPYIDDSRDQLPTTFQNLATNPITIQSMVLTPDLNSTIQRLAFSLTEGIRNNADQVDNIRGKALRSRTFISVQWQWLALPLALTVLTCILLPIVAVDSHRKKVAIWKDDPLALLFHHVEGLSTLSSDNHRTSPKDLSNLADEIDVSLSSGHAMAFERTIGGSGRRTSLWWSRNRRDVWRKS